MDRIKVINVAVIMMFAFLTFGILNLEIVHRRKYVDLSNRNCIRLLPQEGERGKIFDRHGKVMVTNKLSYDVMILPQEATQLDRVLTSVARVLGLNYKDLKAVFKNSYIAPSVPINIANNIDVKKAIILEEMKMDIPGVIIQPRPLRDYPYGRLACHVLGYLGQIDRWRLTKLADYGYNTKDIVGFGGVEERYDYYLRQEEGGLSMEVDHKGRFVRVLGLKPARPGKNIQLTLDLNIQRIVEDRLQARTGSVVIMDPYSGEILAMASSPNFDPSVFVEKSKSSLPGFFNASNAPLINRAISGLYPAASVFKLIVACAGLENAKINLSTTFLCTGSIYVGKQEFSCWDTHNQQDLFAAIAHSCDVFFYRTGLFLGAQAIHDYAVKFGFSRPTAIDLPYEVEGFVPSALWKRIYRLKSWFDGDTVNFSIGQGDLLVTPLQVTRMMAVFANKGSLVTPYVLKAVDGQDISYYQRKSSRAGIKEGTINYMKQALRKVVSEASGTANVLSDLPVSAAGKTGTAQVSRRQPHGWFAGFFPFDKPKFVICVLLEHGGSGYAATVLTKQIIEDMFKEGLL